MSIPYCRSPEVAFSVASRLPLFFSFSPSSFLFFLLLLPLVFQQHSFHSRIKQWSLHSITSKSDASFPMILCIYFYPTCALHPSLWDVYVDTRMTHGCSRPSIFLFLFFFFNTFLLNQDNKLFLFLWFTDTHNDYEFLFRISFFASLYFPVTLWSALFYIQCPVSTFRFFLISQVCTEIEFPTDRRRRGRPRRRKRNVGCAHSCDHGTSWSGGGDISTRYGSDTRFRASLESSEREKRGKTGEKKKESKRARRCL